MNLKKLFLPVLAVLMLASCTKEYITVEEHYDGSQLATTYCTVRPDEWEPAVNNGDTTYWYATYECTSITKKVIDDGAVLAYCIEDGRDNLLPYIIPVRVWTSDTTYDWYLENIRYDLEYNEADKKGYITFIMEDSDFNTSQSIRQFRLDGIRFEFKVCAIRNMKKRAANK